MTPASNKTARSRTRAALQNEIALVDCAPIYFRHPEGSEERPAFVEGVARRQPP